MGGVGLRWAMGFVFVVAVGARLGMMLGGGRVFTLVSNDEWVHVGGAETMLHGLLPYRDFTFLHPPGILLAQVPTALLSRVVGEMAAVNVARVFVVILSSACAAMIVWVCRELGLVAAVVGGLFYAVWISEVIADAGVKLEPFYNAAILAALIGVNTLARRRTAVWMGVLLGLACTLKVACVVPAGAVVLFIAFARSRRLAAWAAGGGVLAAGLVTVPFAVRAPRAFVEQVLLTHGSRPIKDTSIRNGLGPLGSLPQGVELVGIAILGVGVLGWLLWRARTATGLAATGLLWAVFGVAAMTMLAMLPTHYDYYEAILTGSLAVGAAWLAGWAVGSIPRRVHPRQVVAAAFAVLLFVGLFRPRPLLWKDVTTWQDGLTVSQARQAMPVAGQDVATGQDGLATSLGQQVVPRTDGCVFTAGTKLQIATNQLRKALDRRCFIPVDPGGMQLVEHAGFPLPEARRLGTLPTVADVLAAGMDHAQYVVTEPPPRSYGLWTGLPKRADSGDEIELVSQTEHLAVWRLPPPPS